MSAQNKYIFLDRDGTIIHDAHYLKNEIDIRFIDGVFDTLRKFIENQFKLVIVTNQSGISRGYFSWSDYS